MARIITITSGKGGVGKTTISANLAIGLAEHGFRTCLFDADLSLANINLLFGIYPEHDLEDVVLNNRALEDILIRNVGGVDIVPGSSRNENMIDLAPERIEYIIRGLRELDDSYDFVIIDTAPGISRQVISFCKVASDIILVLLPETTSFIDCYGLLNVLQSNGFDGSVWAVFNQVDRIQVAGRLFSKFGEKINNFLSVKINPLGSVVHDKLVREALKQQSPCLLRYPDSAVSKCIENVVGILAANGQCTTEPFASNGFRRQSLDIFKKNLHGLRTGLNIAKRILFSPEVKKEDKPVQKILSTDEIRRPSESKAEFPYDPLAEDPPGVADKWPNQSGTEESFQVPAICEATLIPLDFEAFAECRGNI